MKKLIQSYAFSTLILLSAFFFTACKKGENDPAISLKSRKARLTGEWKLSQGERKYSSSNSTEITTYNGTTQTTNDDGVITTENHTQTLKFEKDGKYTNTIVTTSSGEIQTTTVVGGWSFMSANKSADLKNKEAIVLSLSSLTESGNGTCNCTYKITSFAGGEVLEIDQLKNKELIVKSKSTSASSRFNNTSTTESSMTFIQD